MAQHAWLNPSPFFFEGGPIGCLLIHGFTGAPAEMRPMGEFLDGKGLTVLGIRLPGHGTTLDDLIRTRWTDWAGEAEHGLQQLKERCPMVFVGGLSLGGLLTLYLGERHKVAGLIPMAAALKVSNRLLSLVPLAKYIIRTFPKGSPESDFVDAETYNRLWCYDAWPLAPAHELIKLMKQVRPYLERIVAPILIMHGAHDVQVPLSAAQEIYERVSSAEKELVILQNSGHCVTVDGERETVWRLAYEFIMKHAPADTSL